jgi:spermidine synthase
MGTSKASLKNLEATGIPLAASSSVRLELFFISFILLFLELACIRWFPAYVLFLTFFTNTVLIACFLGMSLGCLAAKQSRNFLLYTPALIAFAMIAALALSQFRFPLESILRISSQASPQVVFFGNDYRDVNPARFFIPIDVVEGFFFLVIALAFIGPGQTLGRALDQVPNRIEAYILNIAGSLAGVLAFAGISRFQLSPFWWFLAVVAGMAYFLHSNESSAAGARKWAMLALGVVLGLSALTSFVVAGKDHRHFWSPYYRIDYYYAPQRRIIVNLISHQTMVSRDNNISPAAAYELPYLLQRDSGASPIQNVLIIGAGSGNDVSRALQWGVRHVDAIEIDPVILNLGVKDHPDRPYADPRVTVHVNDGRNYLRSGAGQYDLIIYALVDSLVLHSSYSDIRLESYLFTREAFSDVRRHLKPHGIFVMYNYFRQGWIVSRLRKELRETFGANPLVFMLPYRETVEPDMYGGFTMLVAGANSPWEEAFRANPEYWITTNQPSGPGSANGFTQRPSSGEQGQWIHVGPANVLEPEDMKTATDDWPFLYVRRPLIPSLSLRGMATMGGLSLLLMALFLPRAATSRGFRGLNPTMFFLGAGFMLVETKAVVHMALLFGSTWMVNTVVFVSVLVMILGANVFVLKLRPQRLRLYYAGLLISLALNVALPLDSFLGMSRSLQATAAFLLVFTPILFAGVIFAVVFRRSTNPDSDFGSNIAGAILGGLAEYSSSLLGFQYLMLLPIGFYALSGLFWKRSSYHDSAPSAETEVTDSLPVRG